MRRILALTIALLACSSAGPDEGGFVPPAPCEAQAEADACLGPYRSAVYDCAAEFCSEFEDSSCEQVECLHSLCLPDLWDGMAACDAQFCPGAGSPAECQAECSADLLDCNASCDPDASCSAEYGACEATC